MLNASTIDASRERAWRWAHPALDDVEFLQARYVTHRYAPHTHDGYAVGVIEAGAESFWYRGAMHVARAGHLLLIDPHELHTGEPAPGSGGWTYRMIYPGVEVMRRAAVAIGMRTLPHFGAPVVADAAV